MGFEDTDDLNRRGGEWLRETARVRVHGSTREVPAERMEKERKTLLPLPGGRFEAA